ncbi:MAG TPA: RNB domain-containing ribonuclease, partial [Geminicoccaceae bacterium]|nr:RNB domain-containing ribonuclease [Geminicoccaceae bacterium]
MTTTTDAPPPLLSREEVLRFLRDSPEPMTKRDLARAFRVKGHDRTELKRLLRELESEGLLERGRGRRLRGRGRLPEVTVLEVIGPDDDGELLARPVGREGGGDGHEGAEPPRVLLPGAQLGRWAPGPGDRVLARLRRVDDGYEGQVMRVLPGGGMPGRILGVLESAGDGLRLRPLDRGRRQEFLVSAGEAKDAGPGDVVAAEVQPTRRAPGLPRAKVIELLGSANDPRAISLMAARAHGLPIDFPPEALAQAGRAEPVGPDGRADLRDLPLVTIDGPDARDFDDAVHAVPDDDPKNPGGWQVVVAIADVAHYVRPDDALDREAFRRGNSAYFPDRAIPMLPEALSNGLCSLRPDEDRACLAVRMWLDADGNKRRHRFARGLMRSRARLTYERVQAARDGAPDDATAPLMESVIEPLYGAYRALDRARRRRGTLDLDLPERQVVLDGRSGRTVAIRARPRLDSHRLIEEFMILANVAAAET